MILASPALAEDKTLKMATIAPSLGQAITMATFANVVSDNVDDVAVEVSGGGAATRCTRWKSVAAISTWR